MRCPCCSKEMTRGVAQSARQIFFTNQAHKNWFAPDVAGKGEVLLSAHNWTRPTCAAFHCPDCKKVVIDYSGNTGAAGD